MLADRVIMNASPVREPLANKSFKLTALDPGGLALLDMPSMARRFFSKVSRTDDPDSCWLWKGEILKDGFPRFEAQGRRASVPAIRFAANRAALVMATGLPLTAGRAVSPACGTRACVNPSHLVELFPVEATFASIDRGRHLSYRKASRDTCPEGHDFSDDNTAIEGGHRRCVECRRANERQRGSDKRERIKSDPAKHERQKAYDREYKARIRNKLKAVAPTSNLLQKVTS